MIPTNLDQVSLEHNQIFKIEIELDLSTTDHIAYKSKFYFGSQQAAANLVYDSANDWMIVTDKNCETCTNKIYDPSSSSTVN